MADMNRREFLIAAAAAAGASVVGLSPRATGPVAGAVTVGQAVGPLVVTLPGHGFAPGMLFTIVDTRPERRFDGIYRVSDADVDSISFEIVPYE